MGRPDPRVGRRALAARSLIHERDIADVAVSALTEDGHVGARYVLTGPETLTQAEQAHAIGDALGRPVRWEELATGKARNINGANVVVDGGQDKAAI